MLSQLFDERKNILDIIDTLCADNHRLHKDVMASLRDTRAHLDTKFASLYKDTAHLRHDVADLARQLLFLTAQSTAVPAAAVDIPHSLISDRNEGESDNITGAAPSTPEVGATRSTPAFITDAFVDERREHLAAVAALREQVHAGTAQIAEILAENDDLKQQLAKQKRRHSRLVQSVQSEKRQLQQKLSESNARTSKIRRENSEVRARNVDLRRVNDHLRQDLSCVHGEASSQAKVDLVGVDEYNDEIRNNG